MSAPWEVLGLTPGCSEQELKQAYARLLKQHRPDKDPEGFRRIRDAYEWMRENADVFTPADTSREPGAGTPSERPAPPVLAVSMSPAQPAQASEISPVEPGEASHVIKGSPVALPPAVKSKPSLLSRVRRTLSKARRAGDISREQKVRALLLKVWRKKKTQGDGWDRLVLSELERDPEKMLSLMSPADAQTDVKRDSSEVAIALLHAFSKRADWPGVMSLLEGMENRLKQNPSAAVAGVLTSGARLIALMDWKRAQKLANDIYPHLSGYERQVQLSELDRQIQAGKEIGAFKVADRAALAHCLTGNTLDADDKTIQAAIRNLSLLNAPTAKTILVEHFPELKTRLRIRKASPQAVATTTNRGSSFDSGIRWWMILLVIFALRTCGSMATRTSSPPSRPSPEQPQIKQEELRKIIEDIKQRNARPDTGKPPDSLIDKLNRGPNQSDDERRDRDRKAIEETLKKHGIKIVPSEPDKR